MQAHQVSKKIESLRELLSLVVANTKREMQGKAADEKKEQAKVASHLTALLGRAPDQKELDQALKYA